jgi:hypothetical protein
VAGSLLIVGLFLMFLALDAYFKVLSVSSNEVSAGEQQAIIDVLELPPKES